MQNFSQNSSKSSSKFPPSSCQILAISNETLAKPQRQKTNENSSQTLQPRLTKIAAEAMRLIR